MIKFSVLFFPLVLIFLLTGCEGPVTINFGGGSEAKGGIFVSPDKGEQWKGMNAVPSVSGEPGSIAGYNTRSLAMDPNDSDAVYFGSDSKGLFYTYNVGEGWNRAKDLPAAGIDAVAVDPDAKCIIYTSLNNEVYQSTDCNRSWESIYYDNSRETRINTIAVDHYDTSRLYIGTTRGEVIRSSDRGDSWKTIRRFNSEVKKIEISPHDSRKLFVATEKHGLFRSDDAGEDWEKLADNMEDFEDRVKYRDLVISPDKEGTVFWATEYGMLRSYDDGDSWERIELITPEEDAIINAIAVNPQNEEEIYYVTDTTFYRSLDGGENWSTEELPTSRAGADLLIDFNNPDIIYLGAKEKK